MHELRAIQTFLQLQVTEQFYGYKTWALRNIPLFKPLHLTKKFVILSILRRHICLGNIYNIHLNHFEELVQCIVLSLMKKHIKFHKIYGVIFAVSSHVVTNFSLITDIFLYKKA